MPPVGSVFKHIDHIQEVFLQKSIWHQIFWLSRSLIFLRKGDHAFAFTMLPSQFILDLLLSHSKLLISSDPLIFLLFYLASLDNVFGCNQLNWPWHFKQWSVAPELSQFPFMLPSCWSIVLVISFSIVSPIYSALQLKFNA